MALTRKKYVLDKKFQVSITIKAIFLPLLTFLIICGILLYFANINDRLIDKNNSYINEIVNTQDAMIEMFLSTPALQNTDNPVIKDGVKTFKSNIGKLKKISDNSIIIKQNSTNFFYIIIIMTIFQSLFIFVIFIIATHRIYGPIHVMRQHLQDLQNGKRPVYRPLRKKDKLKDFYEEFHKAIDAIHDKFKHK